MKITEITNGIHYVGVNDRCKYKFENLWPLPYGVSYNAYLITDKKNVLIDTVDAAYTDRLLDNITEIIGDGKIDYLIINHMEPDHSASIQFIRQKYPQMTIVGNIKTLEMVKGYYGIDDNTLCIKNGESLSIGKRTLTFHLTPMVHWPETMMTYVNEDKLIFSGDAFGCFGTLDGGITDSQLNTDKYWSEMVRYYSNIVGKYGPAVQTALKKLSDIEIKTICSTHGPIWEKEITRVIGIYDRLSQYEGEPGVVIAYGSMYGHTEQMAEEVKFFNEKLKATDTPYILIGPGRWGTRDKLTGIPVLWSDISKARIIVEQGLRDFPLDASLGSHFFHNVTSMNVGYFAVPYESDSSFINYDIIRNQQLIEEKEFVRHVRFAKPVTVYMDGKKQTSVIVE